MMHYGPNAHVMFEH